MTTAITAEQFELGAATLTAAFPVVAIAYYSAARTQLDRLIERDGAYWQIRMTVPKYLMGPVWRWLIGFFLNQRIKPSAAPDEHGGRGEFFMNEELRLFIDRVFTTAFPLGFVTSVISWVSHSLTVFLAGVLLLQVNITALIVFSAQASMVLLADGAQNRAAETNRPDTFWRFSKKSTTTKAPHYLDTRPFTELIVTISTLVLFFLVTLIAAVYVATTFAVLR